MREKYHNISSVVHTKCARSVKQRRLFRYFAWVHTSADKKAEQGRVTHDVSLVGFKIAYTLSIKSPFGLLFTKILLDSTQRWQWQQRESLQHLAINPGPLQAASTYWQYLLPYRSGNNNTPAILILMAAWTVLSLITSIVESICFFIFRSESSSITGTSKWLSEQKVFKTVRLVRLKEDL